MKEVQKIILDAREYIMAMRIEIERKKLMLSVYIIPHSYFHIQSPSETVRITELSCYMSLCGMEAAHKFLAYKNSLNNSYKMNNFITAAHFAKLVLEMEGTGVRYLQRIN